MGGVWSVFQVGVDFGHGVCPKLARRFERERGDHGEAYFGAKRRVCGREGLINSMTRRSVHPVPVIAGITVMVVTVMLGNWQMRRAAEKAEIQLKLEAGAQSVPIDGSARMMVAEWTPVALVGRWSGEHTIYLDNRVHDGRAGFQVLTPLELQHEQGWVLINRGWVAAGMDRTVLPAVTTVDDEVQVTGQVRQPELSPFTLAAQAGQGALWQYLDLAAYRDWSGLPVRDWVVQQASPADDGLVRDWPRPDAGMDRHKGYALQWYSFAGLSLALTGFYVFRSFRSYAT